MIRKDKKKNEKLFHKQTSTNEKSSNKKVDLKIRKNLLSIDNNINNNILNINNNNFLIDLEKKINRTESEENLLLSIKETENLKQLITEKNEEIENNKKKYINELILVNNNIKEKVLQLESSSKNSKIILNKLTQLNTKIKEEYEKIKLSTVINKLKNSNENNKEKDNYVINHAKKLISHNNIIIDKFKIHKEKLEKIISEDNEVKINNLKNELDSLNNNEKILKDEIKQMKLIKENHEKKCLNIIKELETNLERIKNEYNIELEINKINKKQSLSFTKQPSLSSVNPMPNIYKNIMIQKEESEKGQSKPVSINNNIMPQNQEKKNKKEFNDLHTEISNQIFKNKELDIKTYIMSRNKKKQEIEDNDYLFSNKEKNILKNYIPMDCIQIYQNKFKTITDEKKQIIQLINNNKERDKLNKEKNQAIFMNDKKDFNIQKKNIELTSKLLQITKDLKSISKEINYFQKEIDKIKDNYNTKKAENDKLKKIWISFNDNIKNRKIVVKSNQNVSAEELNYINKFGKENLN